MPVFVHEFLAVVDVLVFAAALGLVQGKVGLMHQIGEVLPPVVKRAMPMLAVMALVVLSSVC